MRFIAVLAALALFAAPFMYDSSAQSDDILYVFVQTSVRNSDGALIAYFESDRPSSVNVRALHDFLDWEASQGAHHTFSVGEKNYQLIQREQQIDYHRYEMISSSVLSDSIEGQSIRLVHMPHDGYFVVSGDQATMVWTFFRSL